MRWKGKDGLKFSFGFNPQEQLHSAQSTPKFPSIQITKENTQKLMKQPLKISSQRLSLKRSPSDIYRQLGGAGIELIPRERKLKIHVSERITPFVIDDSSSIQNFETKSVKSAHSVKQRVIYRSDRKSNKPKLQFKDKNFHSLANILEIKHDHFSQRKFQDKLIKNKSHIEKIQQTQKVTSSQAEHHQISQQKPFQDLSVQPEIKNTKKINNNFFQISSHNIEFRQTKKEGKSFEKTRFGSKEKSKIFKNYLQKARPTLRIAGRILNNQKLQHIARDFDEQSIQN